MNGDNPDGIGRMLCPNGSYCIDGASCPFRHQQTPSFDDIEPIELLSNKNDEVGPSNLSYSCNYIDGNAAQLNEKQRRDEDHQEDETCQTLEKPEDTIQNPQEIDRHENVLRNVDNQCETEFSSNTTPSSEGQKLICIPRTRTSDLVQHEVHGWVSRRDPRLFDVNKKPREKPSENVAASTRETVVTVPIVIPPRPNNVSLKDPRLFGANKRIQEHAEIMAASNRRFTDLQDDPLTAILSFQSKKEPSARDKVNKMFKEEAAKAIVSPQEVLKKKLEQIKELCSKQNKIRGITPEPNKMVQRELYFPKSKFRSKSVVPSVTKISKVGQPEGDTNSLETLSRFLTEERKKRRAKTAGQAAELNIANSEFTEEESRLCVFVASKYYGDDNVTDRSGDKYREMRKNLDDLAKQTKSVDVIGEVRTPAGRIIPVGCGVRSSKPRGISQKCSAFSRSDGFSSRTQKEKDEAQLPMDDDVIILDDDSPPKQKKIASYSNKSPCRSVLVDTRAEQKPWPVEAKTLSLRPGISRSTNEHSSGQRNSFDKLRPKEYTARNSIPSPVTKRQYGRKMTSPVVNKTPPKLSPIITFGAPENIAQQKRIACLGMLYEEVRKVEPNEVVSRQKAKLKEKEIADKASTAHGYMSMITAAIGDIRKSKKNS